MGKLILNAFFAILFTLLSGVTSCYSIKQIYYQNDLLNSRRPISTVLRDPSTNRIVREKLYLVQDILSFAKKEAIWHGGIYEYYVPIDRDFITCLVQAAYFDKLEWVTHWFPVVGSVPYLGFFSKKDCVEKANELRKEGFDVAIGEVDAFSSLGWFHDPIYSSMLKRDKTDLAHLLFHEMTHRLFWLPNFVEFNENLAEFVADDLTQKYFKQNGDSEALLEYLSLQQDFRKYRVWLGELKQELYLLYGSSKSTDTRAHLRDNKKRIFDSFVFEKKPDFSNDRFKFIEKREWNNAYLLAASLYVSQNERFKKAFNCFGGTSTIGFINSLKERVKSVDNPYQALDAYCPSP